MPPEALCVEVSSPVGRPAPVAIDVIDLPSEASHETGAEQVQCLSNGRPLPPKPPLPTKRRFPTATVDSTVDASESSDSKQEEISKEAAEAFLASWCSSCEQVFPTRKLLWGCRICDYDICGRCICHYRPRFKPQTPRPQTPQPYTPTPKPYLNPEEPTFLRTYIWKSY